MRLIIYIKAYFSFNIVARSLFLYLRVLCWEFILTLHFWEISSDFHFLVLCTCKKAIYNIQIWREGK